MFENNDREKKNSDFGLDLLANQNKVKSNSGTINLNDIKKEEEPNNDYQFKVEENILENDTDNEYKFNVEDKIEMEDNFPINRNNNINLNFSSKDNKSHGSNHSAKSNNINLGNLDNDSESNDSMSYDNIQPKKSYQEIMNEKYELLYKIDNLKKKGINIPGNVNIESNLEEIKFVYNRVVKDREKLNGVKFARKMLIACCTGIEFLNNRFDPFDFKLDGWSESVHENVNDYDEVFEELHEKYKSKSKMAPELKLMFMLGGSAFMFHLTNSMFKNSMPGMQNILKENPELMKQFQSAAMNSMNNAGNTGMGNFMNMGMNMGMNSNNRNPGNPRPFETPQKNFKPQREMKPPIGVDDIINELDLNEDASLSELLDTDS